MKMKSESNINRLKKLRTLLCTEIKDMNITIKEFECKRESNAELLSFINKEIEDLNIAINTSRMIKNEKV